MGIFWSIFLGLIQGLTEFIPVSSSGHLVLVQELIPEFNQPGILFDVTLHLATLLAVVYFFRKTIFKLSRGYLLLILIGTIPAVLVGLFFQKEFELMFAGINFLGVELLITGILNMLIDKTKTLNKKLTTLAALIIGIAQAISIVPGISRSGATIFTAIKLGVDRKKAAEFSFLLSIPAIIGANILQLLTYRIDRIQDPLFYLAGFISALISGLFSIKLVYKFLLSSKFKIFGYYCLLLGVLVLFFL